MNNILLLILMVTTFITLILFMETGSQPHLFAAGIGGLIVGGENYRRIELEETHKMGE